MEAKAAKKKLKAEGKCKPKGAAKRKAKAKAKSSASKRRKINKNNDEEGDDSLAPIADASPLDKDEDVEDCDESRAEVQAPEEDISDGQQEEAHHEEAEMVSEDVHRPAAVEVSHDLPPAECDILQPEPAQPVPDQLVEPHLSLDSSPLAHPERREECEIVGPQHNAEPAEQPVVQPESDEPVNSQPCELEPEGERLLVLQQPDQPEPNQEQLIPQPEPEGAQPVGHGHELVQPPPVDVVDPAAPPRAAAKPRAIAVQRAPAVRLLVWTDVECNTCHQTAGQFKYSEGPARLGAHDPPTWMMRVQDPDGSWPTKGKNFRRRQSSIVGQTDEFAKNWISQNKTCCG